MGTLAQCRFQRNCLRIVSRCFVQDGTYFNWGTGIPAVSFGRKSGLSRI